MSALLGGSRHLFPVSLPLLSPSTTVTINREPNSYHQRRVSPADGEGEERNAACLRQRLFFLASSRLLEPPTHTANGLSERKVARDFNSRRLRLGPETRRIASPAPHRLAEVSKAIGNLTLSASRKDSEWAFTKGGTFPRDVQVIAVGRRGNSAYFQKAGREGAASWEGVVSGFILICFCHFCTSHRIQSCRFSQVESKLPYIDSSRSTGHPSWIGLEMGGMCTGGSGRVQVSRVCAL